MKQESSNRVILAGAICFFFPALWLGVADKLNWESLGINFRGFLAVTFGIAFMVDRLYMLRIKKREQDSE